MEYRDQNDYERRIAVIHEIASQHPELLKALTNEDRDLLEAYFLNAWSAPDRAEYRRQLLKKMPTTELAANTAYERFLAEAGLPGALPR